MGSRSQEKQQQMANLKRRQMASLRRKAALDQYNTQFFQSALYAYEEAIGLDPSHAGAYKGKADTLLALERCEEACKSYEKCILLDKNYTLAYEG
jgi:Tfp pilus assembly protein PilF